MNVLLPVTGRRTFRYYSDLQFIGLHALFALGSLNGLEIAVGVDLELTGGRLVKHNDTILVQLKGREGDIVAYRSLDGVLDSLGLLAAESEDENLLGATHCGDTD